MTSLGVSVGVRLSPAEQAAFDEKRAQMLTWINAEQDKIKDALLVNSVMFKLDILDGSVD